MNQRTPLKVFIAVENSLLREALVRIFDSEKDIEVVGQAGRCHEAVQQILEAHPDVLLVHPAKPTLAELAEMRKIRQWPLQVKIVLFGMEEDEKVFLEAVGQGIVGYILKDAHASHVVAAVRAVMRGEAVCPPKLCLWLFTYLAQELACMFDLRLHVKLGLTRRERELVPLLARGLTNKEIATHLNVSEQTVKNHVHRMIRKTGANKRLDVVGRCGSTALLTL